MFSPTGANVFRYSALLVGVAYGVSHQQTIYSRERLAIVNREYERKAGLISQAKAEWAKRHAPLTAGGVITDPTDPQFDLEAFLKMKEAEM